jgi:two-component system chemotaxis sensor kinase CheA
MAGGDEYAVPAANMAGVRVNDRADAPHVPHLLACLEPRANERAPYVVEIDLHGASGAGGDRVGFAGASSAVPIGIDGVGGTEEVLVRPLTPLAAGLGPFAGAIVRGDGSLRLAIDAFAIAPRARTLGLVEERASGNPSAPPSSSRRA